MHTQSIASNVLSLVTMNDLSAKSDTVDPSDREGGGDISFSSVYIYEIVAWPDTLQFVT